MGTKVMGDVLYKASKDFDNRSFMPPNKQHPAATSCSVDGVGKKRAIAMDMLQVPAWVQTMLPWMVFWF